MRMGQAISRLAVYVYGNTCVIIYIYSLGMTDVCQLSFMRYMVPSMLIQGYKLIKDSPKCPSMLPQSKIVK